MKRNIVNQYDYSLGLGNYQPEEFKMPSKTIPGQTMSLQEILRRYVRGEQIKQFTPQYAGDDDIPNVERMNEMDRLDMARAMKEELTEIVGKFKKPKPVENPSPTPAPSPIPNPPDAVPPVPNNP